MAAIEGLEFFQGQGFEAGDISEYVANPLVSLKGFLFRGQILKTGVFVQKGQGHGSGGSVAVFAEQDFGNTLLFGVFLVHLFPEDKADDVGILFDGS